MKISLLKPYPTNAKKHDKKQIQQIAASIKCFGFNQPIVIDKNGIIIVGHGRYEAAKLLKMQDVPTIQLNISEEKARAYRIADNKLNESDWNMGLVIEELKNISLNLVEITGFSTDLIIEDSDKDDIIPENVPHKAKLGDIWQLGKHRVMCGDSTKTKDVEKLMGGVLADMVFTDPPYNINYSGRGKQTKNKIKNDNQTQEAFKDFLYKSFINYKKILKEKGGIYICYTSKTHREFEDSLNKANFEVRNQIIWVKLLASMGWGDYRWKHEPILYCHQKGYSLDFYGDRKQYTQWDEEKTDKELLKIIKNMIKKDEDGGSTVWRFNREFNYSHPTQKPVQMIMKAIFNSSKQNNIITDLFLGSGSTLIAAEKTGRICYGMELDPKYVDVIIKRYEEYNGEKAKKVILK